MGYWADLVRYTGVCCLYYRILAEPSASSFAYHGRDQIVVFVLYGYIRLAELSSLEVSLDIVFSTVVGAVFAIINILKPEIHDQSLMPALQSPWFVPHVTVYMFSYSVLGCAFILACMGLYKHRENYLEAADKLVYAGLAFLTVGMLTGAIWAKAAWGHYWSWDPKETWAAVTWTGYLLYVHLRLFRRNTPRTLYWILIVSFLSLQMCWYGVNYLPAAQQSVHLYNRS